MTDSGNLNDENLDEGNEIDSKASSELAHQKVQKERNNFLQLIILLLLVLGILLLVLGSKFYIYIFFFLLFIIKFTI